MPRLRRVARMCSRTVSGTAYRFRHGSTLCSPTVEKILCRSPYFAAVTCRQSAPGYQRKRGDSQEGRNLGVYPLAPPRGAANPLAEVQRKTLRPLGTNTLTQFAHPAQPVQRKRLPPGQGEPAHAVCGPRLITARKRKNLRTNHTEVFSMSYLVCWVIINTGMYQIS